MRPLRGLLLSSLCLAFTGCVVSRKRKGEGQVLTLSIGTFEEVGCLSENLSGRPRGRRVYPSAYHANRARGTSLASL